MKLRLLALSMMMLGSLASCGGSPACTAGKCSYVCYPGFANCDGDDDNGCEANLNTSSLHCGSCATPCPLGPGQPCVVGKCLTRDCDAGGPVK